MDISQINDVNQLKAMAYDQILLRDQAKQNLLVISQRLAEIQNAAQTPPPAEDKPTRNSASQ